MHINIFYSWQSDLPDSYNRDFIHECLTDAINSLSNAEVFDIDLRVDKDTKDVKGTPEIISTVFEKINNSQVFIADISMINSNLKGSTRVTPNPNVLLELGYAAGKLGWDKILLIYNVGFGKVEDLPFDLRTRRPITYNLSTTSSRELSDQRMHLTEMLNSAIYDISKNVSVFANHIVTKLYPYYHSRITNIYLACQGLIEDICDYFGYNHPDLEFSEECRKELQELIDSINNDLAKVEWDDEEYHSGDLSTESRYIQPLFEDTYASINSNIEMLIKFKEGLNIDILALLAKLLLDSRSLDIGRLPHYFNLTDDAMHPSVDSIICIYTYHISSGFVDLIILSMELRQLFLANYQLHKDEFIEQERQRNRIDGN